MVREMMMAALVATTMLASSAMAVPKDFAAKADALLRKSYPAGGPGVTVVVTEHGRTVYNAAVGMADIDAKVPLKSATPMRLGSITKQFTAAVVMQLVEEGKVGLDDKLSRFLPDYPAPGADVTVRQLLNHTSGIQSYTGIPGFMKDHSAEAHTTAQLIDRFKAAPMTFTAGTDWAYNNSGYILLQAVIEKATGRPWYEEVDRRIARPLGLKSLRYGAAPDGEKGMAHGYRLDGGKVVPARPIAMSVPGGAGALVADAGDLARWAQALHHGQVVKPASYALMIASTTLPSGRKVDYGFGLIPGELRGHPTIAHDGGIFGFSTDSRYVVDADLFVAVLANTEQPEVDPEMITRKLAALAIGDPFEEFTAVPLEAKAVEPFLGVYRAGDVERALTLRDGKLMARRKGGGPLEVQSAGKGRYFYDGSLGWFDLSRDGAGKPVMTFHAEGAAKGEVMSYAGPNPAEAAVVALPKAALDRLAGTYNGPVPILVAVDAAGGLTLKFGPQDVTHLLPESATLFRVKEIEAKVRFEEEGGKVTALTILQNGKELKAARQ